MKKFLALFAVAIVAVGILAGCSSPIPVPTIVQALKMTLIKLQLLPLCFPNMTLHVK